MASMNIKPAKHLAERSTKLNIKSIPFRKQSGHVQRYGNTIDRAGRITTFVREDKRLSRRGVRRHSKNLPRKNRHNAKMKIKYQEQKRHGTTPSVNYKRWGAQTNISTRHSPSSVLDPSPTKMRHTSAAKLTEVWKHASSRDIFSGMNREDVSGMNREDVPFVATPLPSSSLSKQTQFDMDTTDHGGVIEQEASKVNKFARAGAILGSKKQVDHVTSTKSQEKLKASSWRVSKSTLEPFSAKWFQEVGKGRLTDERLKTLLKERFRTSTLNNSLRIEASNLNGEYNGHPMNGKIENNFSSCRNSSSEENGEKGIMPTTLSRIEASKTAHKAKEENELCAKSDGKTSTMMINKLEKEDGRHEIKMSKTKVGKNHRPSQALKQKDAGILAIAMHRSKSGPHSLHPEHQEQVEPMGAVYQSKTLNNNQGSAVVVKKARSKSMSYHELGQTLTYPNNSIKKEQERARLGTQHNAQWDPNCKYLVARLQGLPGYVHVTEELSLHGTNKLKQSKLLNTTAKGNTAGATKKNQLHVKSIVMKKPKKEKQSIIMSVETKASSTTAKKQMVNEDPTIIKSLEGRAKKTSNGCSNYGSKSESLEQQDLSKGTKKDPPGGSESSSRSNNSDISSKKKEGKGITTTRKLDPPLARPSRSRRSKSLTKAETDYSNACGGSTTKSFQRSKSVPPRAHQQKARGRSRQPNSSSQARPGISRSPRKEVIPSAKAFMYRLAFLDGVHAAEVKGISNRLIKSIGTKNNKGEIANNVHDTQPSITLSSRASSSRKSQLSKNGKPRKVNVTEDKHPSQHQRPSSTWKSSKSTGDKSRVSTNAGVVRFVSKKKYRKDNTKKTESSSSSSSSKKSSRDISAELKISKPSNKGKKRASAKCASKSYRISNTQKNMQQMGSILKNPRRKRISSQFHVRQHTSSILSAQQSLTAINQQQQPWQQYSQRIFGGSVMLKNVEEDCHHVRHSSSAKCSRLRGATGGSTMISQVTSHSCSGTDDTGSTSSNSLDINSNRENSSSGNSGVLADTYVYTMAAGLQTSRRSTAKSNKNSRGTSGKRDYSDKGDGKCGLRAPVGISQEVSKLLNLGNVSRI